MGRRLDTVVRELSSNRLKVRDVPPEWEHQIEVLRVERQMGLRVEGNRGYDVIANRFFVEETIYEMYRGEMIPNKQTTVHFDDFAEYYAFLDGDIYENACYRYLDLDRYNAFIEEFKIDVNRLMDRDAFVTRTIDEMQYAPSQEELRTHTDNRKLRKKWTSWTNKLNACKTTEEFKKVLKRIVKTGDYKDRDIKSYIMSYAFCHPDDEGCEVIKGYLLDTPQMFDDLVRALCTVYDPEQVIECYRCYGNKDTLNRHKRELRKYAEYVKDEAIVVRCRSNFDADKSLYCVNIERRLEGVLLVQYQIYYASFEEYAAALKGDLTNADLTKAYDLEADLSEYHTDGTTLLPLTASEPYSCECIKGYDNRGFFYIQTSWRNEAGRVLKRMTYQTHYLYDYVHYLKGDLSDADLTLCDGLLNLSKEDMAGINLAGAALTSKVCKRLGVSYEAYDYNRGAIGSFDETVQNEALSLPAVVWQEDREITLCNSADAAGSTADDGDGNQTVYYISDLHLLHRLQNAGCETRPDINHVMYDVTRALITEIRRTLFGKGTLLIGGDVASDYTIFSLFIRHLAERRRFYRDQTNIVFVLGNHELWPFAGERLENIIQRYRDLIESNGMYLLHNEILYQDSVQTLHRIPYKEIMESDTRTLRERLLRSRMVLLGGIGFSGYNTSFNANNGIYRNALNREDEIRETTMFESLYNKAIPALRDKNTVILTHMPYYDWCKKAGRENGLVYVSGHTHHNDYCDDGDLRYYADNQIGYGTRPVHLRTFAIGAEFDIFADYADGIYEITKEQYLDFCVGKHLRAGFNNAYAQQFYMIKRNGYYCYMIRWKNGNLGILNGGQVKNVAHKELQYYYDHMDDQIAMIMQPLVQFTAIQQKVSKAIKDIGGEGTIHGCIVDIDFYNHVYVNPYDLKLTGYWALDIVNKMAFPSVPALLKKNCPALYGQLVKRIEDTSTNAIVPVGCAVTKNTVYDAPVRYESRDIYKASREIKKMQKLYKNVLTAWYEMQEKGHDQAAGQIGIDH